MVHQNSFCFKSPQNSRDSAFQKHYAVKFNYRQNIENNIKSKQKIRVTQDHLD